MVVFFFVVRSFIPSAHRHSPPQTHSFKLHPARRVFESNRASEPSIWPCHIPCSMLSLITSSRRLAGTFQPARDALQYQSRCHSVNSLQMNCCLSPGTQSGGERWRSGSDSSRFGVSQSLSSVGTTCLIILIVPTFTQTSYRQIILLDLCTVHPIRLPMP